MTARERVEEYRRMAREVLVPLAETRAGEMARAQEELDEWEELAATLTAMAAHVEAGSDKPMKLLPDVGGGFRMHARVAPDDARSVFLHVGAGVYPQLSLHEAQAYAGAKVDALGRLVREARDALVAVRTDLAVARSAIAALGAMAEGEGGDDDGDGGEEDDGEGSGATQSRAVSRFAAARGR